MGENIMGVAKALLGHIVEIHLYEEITGGTILY